MIYTVIFVDDEGQYSQEIHMGTHNVRRTWRDIQLLVDQDEANGWYGTSILAIIPGRHEVYFERTVREGTDQI